MVADHQRSFHPLPQCLLFLSVFVKRRRPGLSKSSQDEISQVIIALNAACLFMGMDNGKRAEIAEVGDVFSTFDCGIRGNAFGVSDSSPNPHQD